MTDRYVYDFSTGVPDSYWCDANGNRVDEGGHLINKDGIRLIPPAEHHQARGVDAQVVPLHPRANRMPILDAIKRFTGFKNAANG